MRRKFSVVLLGFAFLAGPMASIAATGAANASWNSGSNGQGNLAFWIRDREGSCDEQRSVAPLVFAAKALKAGASSGPLQVKELRYCMLFAPDSAEKIPDGSKDAVSNCTSGSVEFSYEAKTNEYQGKYDLTMKNNVVRRGEFRAQFCAQKKAVKK
jgi:hypothetical protein